MKLWAIRDLHLIIVISIVGIKNLVSLDSVFSLFSPVAVFACPSECEH